MGTRGEDLKNLSLRQAHANKNIYSFNAVLYMKRNLLISFGVSASLLAMPLTFAYALDLTENITLVLPSDSTSFTLDSGAKFNTLGINNSSFDLTLDSGDIITIHDSSKRASIFQSTDDTEIGAVIS